VTLWKRNTQAIKAKRTEKNKRFTHNKRSRTERLRLTLLTLNASDQGRLVGGQRQCFFASQALFPMKESRGQSVRWLSSPGKRICASEEKQRGTMKNHNLRHTGGRRNQSLGTQRSAGANIRHIGVKRTWVPIDFFLSKKNMHAFSFRFFSYFKKCPVPYV